MIDYFGDANKILVIIFPSRPKWTAFMLENVILQRCSQNISLLRQLNGPKMPKRHLVLIFLFLILNLFKKPHNARLQSMFQLPIVHVWRLKACLVKNWHRLLLPWESCWTSPKRRGYQWKDFPNPGQVLAKTTGLVPSLKSEMIVYIIGWNFVNNVLFCVMLGILEDKNAKQFKLSFL